MKSFLKSVKNVLHDVSLSLKTSYYCFFYYRRKLDDKKVLFESRNGLDVAGNIFRLATKLSSGSFGEYKIYLSVVGEITKKAQSMLKRYNIENIMLVEQGSKKYQKLLATAKYIFTDTSLPRTYVKKKGQIYTNTWHGTPLKTMGKYNLGELHSMGNIQRNLLFSDYLIFPNDYMMEKMLESYNIDKQFSGEILCAGYPRNSVFLSEEDEKYMKKTLGFSDKKVYAYLPTWKAENMGDSLDKSLCELNARLKNIDALLRENEILLLKLHPFLKGSVDTASFSHIVSFPEDFEGYDVLCAADVLITDYSSVMFDFGCTKKKIVLYTPDEEDYCENRGLYIPLSELPFKKTASEKELVSLLRLPIDYDADAFFEKFCTYDNINSAEKILSRVMNGKDTCKVVKLDESPKQKVLFYCGALLKNGLTASFKNLLSMLDLDKRDYYFTFKQSAFSNADKLISLPEGVRLFAMASNMNYTFAELLATAAYYNLNVSGALVRKLVDRALERNAAKHFTGLKIDYLVNFSGYDKVIMALLQKIKAKHIIFVHSDMQKEIKLRNNQHYLSLRKAYREYDKVAVVIDTMAEPTSKISGRTDNIVVVNNAVNYKRIVENAEKPTQFGSDTFTSVHNPGGIEAIMNSDAKKFITVGRFSPEKQHTMLIDAFAQYWEKNKNSFLIIIGGEGGLYGKTVSYANKTPCRNNIAIIKSIENPMPILKRADLFVLCSKYEAQPVVIFEADALRVPSVCTDIEGPSKMIKSFGGTVVENSTQGLLSAFSAFDEGKIKTMNIDFEKYNQTALSQFEELFN